jgi:hypothetical protein
MVGRGLGALILLLLVAAPVRAQNAPKPAAAPASAASAGIPVAPAVISRDEAGNTFVRATRITEPLRIDGRLDDAAYSQVQSISDFVQQEPRQGQPSSEKSEVWVLFDDKNIYFTCRCWEAHPDLIVANEMRRDVLIVGGHDHLGIGIDTFQDKRNGVFLLVTPAGGMFDALMFDESAINKDWNAVWTSRAGRFDGGWVVEMAVPFRSLRYRRGREQTWGIQFRRVIRHSNEYTYMTEMPAVWGNAALMRTSRFPTLVGLEAPPPGRNLEIKPYGIADLRTDRLSVPAISNQPGADAGIDAKYGVTKGLTLDLTYNTDFAQVEDDEAQVNLSRFNLFFPEKREFFLEGQGIFAFGGAGNQIGRASGTSVTPTLFFSRNIGLAGGREVPIVGGARLTGRAGRYSIGAVNIRTGEEATAGVQPTTFSVMRVKRDILGRSMIGAMVTHRSNALTHSGANTVYGADAQFAHQFLNVNAYVARSDTPGLRGDAVSYRTQLDYNADRYGLEIERLVVGDDFNPGVGFMRRENFRRNFAQARFSPRTRRNKVVRKYYFESSFDYITDNRNRLESREIQQSFRTDLQNGDKTAVEYTRNLESIRAPFTISPSDDLSVPIGHYEFQNLKAQYELGAQYRLAGTTAFETGTFYGGTKRTLSFTGRMEITIPFSIEPNVSFNWLDLPGGKVLTRLVSTRTTYTMTPRMFLSALVQYNSTTTALSSNIRFRWEYIPGSELFVVYSEGRDTFPVRRIDLENRGFVVKINRMLRF